MASRSPLALLSVLVIFVAGCKGGGQPAPDAPASLDVEITAMADVNPNPSGVPAPVKVRIFELRSDTAFRESTFRDLQNDRPAAIAADLVGSVHWEILFPGSTQRLDLMLQPSARYLGLVADFRLDPTDRQRDRALVPLSTKGGIRRLFGGGKLEVTVFKDSIVAER